MLYFNSYTRFVRRGLERLRSAVRRILKKILRKTDLNRKNRVINTCMSEISRLNFSSVCAYRITFAICKYRTGTILYLLQCGSETYILVRCRAGPGPLVNRFIPGQKHRQVRKPNSEDSDQKTFCGTDLRISNF